MRTLGMVSLDTTSDTSQGTSDKTAKPVPNVSTQPPKKATTPDDIPDQEVENQTKFIKALEDLGPTPGLLVLGVKAGYLTSTSLIDSVDHRNYKGVGALEALEDANETLLQKLKEKCAKVVEKFTHFKEWVKEKFAQYVKPGVKWVCDNPIKATAAASLVTLFGVFMTRATKDPSMDANVFKKAFEDFKNQSAKVLSTVRSKIPGQGVKNGVVDGKLAKSYYDINDNPFIKVHNYIFKVINIFNTVTTQNRDVIRSENATGKEKLKAAFNLMQVGLVLTMFFNAIGFIIAKFKFLIFTPTKDVIPDEDQDAEYNT